MTTFVQPAATRFSTRLLRKGALVEETYRALQAWEPKRSFPDNLRQIRASNAVGAVNGAWLQEVTATISSRFKNGTEHIPLARLAKKDFPLDQWRLCMLWHIGQTDPLFHQFATEWLFSEFARGTYSLRTEAVIPFVAKVLPALSDYGTKRAARDLLLMAKDLGLLSGGVIKRFQPLHIPEGIFLYVLYAIRERQPNARRIIESRDWRLFLMSPEDVERELLNIHQFRKLHYETAGTMARLTLPLASFNEYLDQLTS